MLHKKRVFRVVQASHVDELARALVENTWCACNGFRIGPLLLLNDSTCADAAQEYAVFEEKTGTHIESLTVSWMTPEHLALQITRMLTRILNPGECRLFTPNRMPSLAHPEGSCEHCA